MSEETDNLLEYYNLLQAIAAAGKTHAAIIKCLGLLSKSVQFINKEQEVFFESLHQAMADSAETLKQIEKAETIVNKHHHSTLSGLGNIPKTH